MKKKAQRRKYIFLALPFVVETKCKVKAYPEEQQHGQKHQKPLPHLYILVAIIIQDLHPCKK